MVEARAVGAGVSDGGGGSTGSRTMGFAGFAVFSLRFSLGDSVSVRSAVSFANNIFSTSALGVPYFFLEAVMIRCLVSAACSGLGRSSIGMARLKSKSLRSTRAIASPVARFWRSSASKYPKPSPSFRASSSPTRKTIRVYGLDITALATSESRWSCRNSWWASVRPKRYFRAPERISAIEGVMKLWNSSM